MGCHDYVIEMRESSRLGGTIRGRTVETSRLCFMSFQLEDSQSAERVQIIMLSKVNRQVQAIAVLQPETAQWSTRYNLLGILPLLYTMFILNYSRCAIRRRPFQLQFGRWSYLRQGGKERTF